MTRKPSQANRIVYILIGAALLLSTIAIVIITINSLRDTADEEPTEQTVTEDVSTEVEEESNEENSNESEDDQDRPLDDIEDPALPELPVIELPNQ